MKYKLICMDIDGTLLNDHKRLLPKVKEAVRDAADQGIRIVLASGRMPAGVELVESELGLSCIKICNAGTYILIGDECVRAEHLSLETMNRIYENIAVKYGIPLWIFEGRKWYVTGIDSHIEREIRIIRQNPEVVSVRDLTEMWGREKVCPNKLLLAAAPGEVSQIYRELKECSGRDIDMACSTDTYVEIFPKGVTKGKALNAVCHELHINMDETAAFGDQELDIPMIEAAGLGIAMGNAIRELKDKADFVTRSNNDAGVAYALEQYLL